ncbi:MAG: DUF5694 domain-containing protein [Bacteroidota bacterium]
MRPLPFLFILSSLIFISVSQSQNSIDRGTDDVVPKVAILGMFHFGETSDLAAITMEDTKGERRQREIQEVVDKLKAFSPTKILVEYPISKNDTLNSRYQAYLKGDFELPVSETYQIGFRLGKQLGHDMIFGMDHRMDLPFDKVMEYCLQHNKMEEFQAIVEMVQSYTREQTAILAHTHLATFLGNMNSPQMDRFANALYLDQVLAIGEPGNEVGAQMSAAWYERNMIMLKNTTHWIADREERILIIVGSSHRAMLKDFINNRDDLEFVEISNFLKK